MHRVTSILIAVICLASAAEPQNDPLADPRLSVHTLVREDIFAGVMDNDLDRLARGEKKIETLLVKRPGEKAPLLAWKAGATMYRSVLALEADRKKEFEEKYAQAIDLQAQAKKLGPKDMGVTAATAGFYAQLADRLPEKQRAKAWAAAYQSYLALWEEQKGAAKALPLHLRGELLGGLAQSAQRTGHDKELAAYLDKILEMAPDSPYARVAKQWKEDPTAPKSKRLTCLTCHAPGRLAARHAAPKGE
jgi:hypothetical protein